MTWWETIQYVLHSDHEVLGVLMITAVTCSLIGSFLVLRRLAMIADAISHSVLLGLVLAYFLTKDVASPWLTIGAAIFGLITVWSTETLPRSGLVKGNDAIGLVYPFFFAIAVILLTRYGQNVHLDADCILMGEVILTPLNRVSIFNISLPKAMVEMLVLLLINSAFIGLLYKELKANTFDAEFAKLAGFSGAFLFYGLMTLTSFTTVVAFDAVGAILVISFLIAPGAAANLSSKTLGQLLLNTVLFAILNSCLGYFLALHWNVSMSGMTATVAGLTFLATLLCHRQGVVTQWFTRRRKRREFKEALILLHIAHHSNAQEAAEELGTTTIHQHLQWQKEKLQPLLKKLLQKQEIMIQQEDQIYQLTPNGLIRLDQLKEKYQIN